MLVYLLVFGLGLGMAVLIASPGGTAQAAVAGTLTGSVGTSSDGNAFEISLSASTVPAGTYEFDITDYATIHNFDLLGPGNVSIDKTSVSGTGSVKWTVTLSPGTYTYHCDAHPSILTGTLTVTGGATSTSTTSPTTTGETSTSTPTTVTTIPTTTPPTTATTPTGGGTAPLKVRITAVHATRKRVVVTVASNQLTRAVATLVHKHRLIARVARDGRKLKLTLKPRHPLKPGSYVVQVKVACCGTSSTAKKTIRIR